MGAAKKIIVGAIESLAGEYIPSVNRDNLKIGLLRGKITLTDVPLDGDLIGSHVLGAVGLSGFGVLSCHARELRISVPWKSLERDPTSFELRGVHLVCVPLAPGTTGRVYGCGSVSSSSSSSNDDPRCALRTMAKRAALARLERNFFAGRIAGEGPAATSATASGGGGSGGKGGGGGKGRSSRSRDRRRDVSGGGVGGGDVDRAGKQETSRRSERNSGHGDEGFEEDDEDDETDENDENDSSASSSSRQDRSSWMAKLKAKIFRNIEMSIRDAHVRCEVPEGGLELRGDDERDERGGSFAFGFDLGCVVIRTSSGEWDSGGGIDGGLGTPVDVTAPGNGTDGTGGDGDGSGSGAPPRKAGGGTRSYKVVDFHDLSFYWDDSPPVLVSESELMVSGFAGAGSAHRYLSSTKIHRRVAAAMEALRKDQDPGSDIVDMLSCSSRRSPGKGKPPEARGAPPAATPPPPRKPHVYGLESLSFQIRATFVDNGPFVPSQCLGELPPCRIGVDLRPWQYRQYQRLRTAMFAQQRVDTMLHQRPDLRPTADPRAWWKYSIACVVARPNWRPWRDVVRIARCRPRYLELVEKKLVPSDLEGNGRHRGLSEAESLELLRMEDYLPIEALLSFHLLALRRVVDARVLAELKARGREQTSITAPGKSPYRRSKSRLSRIRRSLVGGSGKGKPSAGNAGNDDGMEEQLLGSSSALLQPASLDDDDEEEISEEPLKAAEPKQFAFKAHSITASVRLLKGAEDNGIARIEANTSGIVRSLGNGKNDMFFDVRTFEVISLVPSDTSSGTNRIMAFGSIVDEFNTEVREGTLSKAESMQHKADKWTRRDGFQVHDFECVRPVSVRAPSHGSKRNLEQKKPAGVVCRVIASTDLSSVAMSVSARPATLIWDKPCFDSLADFFSSPAPEMQSVLIGQLRNAATPLAHKAQLALMSPMSISLRMNVNAPKLWVPISSHYTDGAIFLDAGRIKMNLLKAEGVTETKWDVFAREMQVKFVRGICGFHLNDEAGIMPKVSPEGFGSPAKEISVVRPFQMNVVANLVGEKERAPVVGKSACVGTTVCNISDIDGTPFAEAQSQVSVTVGDLDLNLADVDTLASAIGKWYAAGVLCVKERSAHAARSSSKIRKEISKASGKKEKNMRSSPLEVTVSAKKIEMMLECFSKTANASFEEKTAVSDRRTYMVSLLGMEVGFDRSERQQTSTNFTLEDIKVVQMADKVTPTSRCLKPSAEAMHQILVRAGKQPITPMENQESLSPMTNQLIPPPGAPRSPQAKSPQRTFNFPGSSMGHLPNTLGAPDASPLYTAAVSRCRMEDPIVRLSYLHDGGNHLDEIDIVLEPFIVRVTPTSLKDFTKGVQRVVDLGQLMTTEMERKIHEEGRCARRLGKGGAPKHSRSKRATFTDHADFVSEQNPVCLDSSLLFRLTLKEATILAGRPVPAADPLLSPSEHRGLNQSLATGAVMQVMSSALIMFQSVENPDSSGTKTLHVSADNLSTSIITSFEPVLPSEAPPSIGPTAAEFRVVYSTVNQGVVVSQDFSIDCESLKSCVTPSDLLILSNMSSIMAHRLKTNPKGESANNCIADPDLDVVDLEASNNKTAKKSFSTLLRFKKRGTGIATSVRFELQKCSFVLLRPLTSQNGTRPFLDINANHTKGKLDGCMSALSGECSSLISVDFFNCESTDWEYAIEPFDVIVALEQMPNELTLSAATSGFININFTGALLSDIVSTDFNILWPIETNPDDIPLPVTPLSLPTKGLRRSNDLRSIVIQNDSGLDLLIYPVDRNSLQTFPANEKQHPNILLPRGSAAQLDPFFGVGLASLVSSFAPTVAIGLAPSAVEEVGRRELVMNLPLSRGMSESKTIHRLIPDSSELQSKRPLRNGGSRSDPIMSSCASPTLHDIEPVVEWCMQNQRLRSTTADVYSLEKGKDVLSSVFWSPGDESISDSDGSDGPSYNRNRSSPFPQSSDFAMMVTTPRTVTTNWLKPYLNNDSPEWTDMTCTLKMVRDRVMLPDDDWIWANDWTVDLSGDYGDMTDADGWEYETDFDAFGRSRRFYRRGDLVRRRRWTRTRMIKPPKLDNPFRPLSIVWETLRDEDSEHFTVKVGSHVKLHNRTDVPLSFFVHCFSWDNEMYVGNAAGGESICIPVILASGTYLRLAKIRTDKSAGSLSLKDYRYSDRLMILPTSHTSSVFLRTSMRWTDKRVGLTENTSKPDRLHFLVHIDTRGGITNININPILRIFNLLPCHLQFQLGETIQTNRGISTERKVVKRVEGSVDIGKESSSGAIDPKLKPHISLRVPGYKWSTWQRIVNRKANSHTWQPPHNEEDILYQANKEDVDHVDEYKTVVKFERLTPGGNMLNLILSVEMGHCPTLRIYSQYWIMDKTGFGLHFADGFKDVLGTTPIHASSRRSYLDAKDSKLPKIKKELHLPGHQWSIGMSGMSLYYSKKERLAISIECGVDDYTGVERVRSRWTATMDVSNVMPKTVFSLPEYDGPRRFELSYDVRLAPSIFSRTKFITIYPRFQLVNLMDNGLFVAQDGCLRSETFIPSQSSVPFHWEESTLPPKIRLCQERAKGGKSSDETMPDHPWTNGSIQLDKVGITSMRLPGDEAEPVVVQVEVRLATVKQSSAVVVLIWSTCKASNPLYLLRNRSSQLIFCCQPLEDVEKTGASLPTDLMSYDGCSSGKNVLSRYEVCSSSNCNASDKVVEQRGSSLSRLLKEGSNSSKNQKHRTEEEKHLFDLAMGPESATVNGLAQVDEKGEHIWELKQGQSCCFGFDDPEKKHLIEWTSSSCSFDERCTTNICVLDVDALGSSSELVTPVGVLSCHIRAEHSTKVIEFVDLQDAFHRSHLLLNSPALSLKENVYHFQNVLYNEGKLMTRDCSSSADDKRTEEELITFTFRLDLPGVTVSVVDNAVENVSGREILFLQAESWMVEFSQSRDGYHELELQLMSLQVDNHVSKSIHPVLVFCPRLDQQEPFVHISAVRRLQPHSSTYVFRYVALRVLTIDIFLDRITAETIARFIQPLRKVREAGNEDPEMWITEVTTKMARKYAHPDRRAPRDIEQAIHTANSGRVYLEQLILHPIRLSLTFTQEWMDWNPATEGLMIFQFIRGMASIANAPLVFTSFIANHAFEAPQSLVRIVSAHYSSQLTKQIFAILGSLAILNGPADFLANVGTGVRDFFYEPINGIMYGPAQFIEGLETGAQSLARGIFVGVVRGVSNVTEVVNSNLAGLTADEAFIDERAAHQRLLTDAMSRGKSRTMSDSFYLAGASVARGVKSGALGIVEQPAIMSSKHGPVGFVQGIAKALVGVIVKPVVGIGDAAVLVMNHVSEATSQKEVILKIPKRFRRALPRKSPDQRYCVLLVPYDEKAAKAQRIVTGNESNDDVYVGHVNIPNYLIIASEQCLWAIDHHSRDPWCLSWEEISHFHMDGDAMQVTYFSMFGLKSHVFHVASAVESAELCNLLLMHTGKMGNCTSKPGFESFALSNGLHKIGCYNIPGVNARQVNHVFGSCNSIKKRIGVSVKDEIDVIEQCFARVKNLGCEMPRFFKSLDEEAWMLINSWGQVFSGLSSRRCIAAGIINGTGTCVQIKSTKLMEGGSPMYIIPSKEYDQEQGILYPGGVIILFAWGAVPSLVQAGRVFMSIETNAFLCDLADRKSNGTYATPMPGYQVGFLEKSFDPSLWWAKYWLLVRKR